MSQVVCERCFHLNKHCTCHPPAQSDPHSYDARLEAQLTAQQETQPLNDSWPQKCAHGKSIYGDERCSRCEAADLNAQPAPDVVERMLTVYSKNWFEPEDIINCYPRMTAAAQVLLAEVEQVTYDVVLDWSGDARNAEDVSKNVRARLSAKPKQETREQQVTAILQETVKETNERWIAAAEKVARVRETK